MNFFSKIKDIAKQLLSGAEDEAPEEFELTDSDESFRDGLFLNSLDEFSEADIKLSEKAASAPRFSFAEVVRKIVFFVFLAIFIVSSVLLVQNLISKQRGNEIYNKLEEEFFAFGFNAESVEGLETYRGAVKALAADSAMKPHTSMSDAGDASGTVEITAEHNEELEKMRAGLVSLLQINPDTYGWISVEGTDINYPIVQGDDNEFYLHHAYTGEFLPMGAIFADYRCDGNLMNNQNTVLYGHNIENMIGRSMFHDVVKFFRDEYFFGTYIYIYTLDGIYVYEPFSIYETRYDYWYFKTSFDSDEAFVRFVNEVHSNSAKTKETQFNENDRLLTLSTCTNGPFYARYALHARLIKVIE